MWLSAVNTRAHRGVPGRWGPRLGLASPRSRRPCQRADIRPTALATALPFAEAESRCGKKVGERLEVGDPKVGR
jgi:hypothetical protein